MKQHYKGHANLADMVKGHIGVWRDCLKFRQKHFNGLICEDRTAERNYIEHELNALSDIEKAVNMELGQ